MTIKVKHYSLEKSEPRLLSEETITLPGKIAMLRDADEIVVETDRATVGEVKCVHADGVKFCQICAENEISDLRALLERERVISGGLREDRDGIIKNWRGAEIEIEKIHAQGDRMAAKLREVYHDWTHERLTIVATKPPQLAYPVETDHAAIRIVEERTKYTDALLRVEAVEARCAKLENALRKIANHEVTDEGWCAEEIARCALVDPPACDHKQPVGLGCPKCDGEGST